MPADAVYLVAPRLIACTAAVAICSGVARSGSPIVKSTIALPAALSVSTFFFAAMLGEGLMRCMRCASNGFGLVIMVVISVQPFGCKQRVQPALLFST